MTSRISSYASHLIVAIFAVLHLCFPGNTLSAPVAIDLSATYWHHSAEYGTGTIDYDAATDTLSISTLSEAFQDHAQYGVSSNPWNAEFASGSDFHARIRFSDLVLTHVVGSDPGIHAEFIITLEWSSATVGFVIGAHDIPSSTYMGLAREPSTFIPTSVTSDTLEIIKTGNNLTLRLVGTPGASWNRTVPDGNFHLSLTTYASAANSSGRAGVSVSFSDIEIFEGTLANSVGSNLARDVQSMYVAYYGRPADPDGRNYWVERLDADAGDWTAIIDAFGTSAEYTSRFGLLDTETLIDNLYIQMFGRHAEILGLNFYSDRLLNGHATLAQIALQIADGALNEDLSTLDHRIESADYFTHILHVNDLAYELEDIDDAAEILGAVDSTTASVEKAMDAIDALLLGIVPLKTGLWSSSIIEFFVSPDGTHLTDEGSPIVSENEDAGPYALRLGPVAYSGACRGTITTALRVTPPVQISDSGFHWSDSVWEISGTFERPDQASGTYSMSQHHPSCRGYVHADGNWEASPAFSAESGSETNEFPVNSTATGRQSHDRIIEIIDYAY